MSRLIARTPLLPAALGLVVVLTAGTAAKAQSAFDGLWSVQIAARGGPCGSGYITYPVRIVRGAILNAGGMSFAVSGRVDQRGVVRVSLASGADRANAAGRLSRSSGSGQWTSPTRGCAGTWTAARQG